MNTQSNFTGVFTLKTQEEVQALANAVQNLVEKSVNVFSMMSSGRAQELLGYMMTINQVAPSFLDLTIDENEKARAKAVLDSLSLSQAALNTHLIGTSSPDGETRKLISRHMGTFLEKVADLCDMMEENQLNRGVQTVQQAVKYMDILAAERPASQVFLPKLEHVNSSLTYVDKLLENRISVADEGALKVKMQQVKEELRVARVSLPNSAKALNQQPTNEIHASKYKEDVTRVLEVLKVIMALVQGKEVRIKTSSNFSHETINAALASLEDAVKTHDRNLATENAKTIVQEVQNAGSEELKAKTKEVVQATINALGGGYEDELSKALAELKDLAGSVHAENLGGVQGGGSTLGRNNVLRQRLTEAAKDISNNVEDLFSPRSERFRHL